MIFVFQLILLLVLKFLFFRFTSIFDKKDDKVKGQIMSHLLIFRYGTHVKLYGIYYLLFLLSLSLLYYSAGFRELLVIPLLLTGVAVLKWLHYKNTYFIIEGDQLIYKSLFKKEKTYRFENIALVDFHRTPFHEKVILHFPEETLQFDMAITGSEVFVQLLKNNYNGNYTHRALKVFQPA